MDEITAIFVRRLLAIVDESPEPADAFSIRGPYAEQVRSIGWEIYRAGGDRLMSDVHQATWDALAESHPDAAYRLAGCLEYRWDSIGSWYA